MGDIKARAQYAAVKARRALVSDAERLERHRAWQAEQEREAALDAAAREMFARLYPGEVAS